MEQTVERWYSMNEIAEHLGISRDTVLNWINDKKCPLTRLQTLEIQGFRSR